MLLKKMLVLFGVLLVTAVILAACGGQTTTAPTGTEPVAAPEVTVPFLSQWQNSGHDKVSDEPFRHWDSADPAEVPTSCAKCHTSAGFVDFAADGKVDKAVPAKDAQGITCAACHSPEAMALTSVTFPSGKVVETTEEGEGRCMTCHQGRESKVSVDKQINETFKVADVDAVVAPIKDDKGNTVNFGFRNVHYFAAGATLYGSQAEMGYEYDGKTYDPKLRHVPEFDTCYSRYFL